MIRGIVEYIQKIMSTEGSNEVRLLLETLTPESIVVRGENNEVRIEKELGDEFNAVRYLAPEYEDIWSMEEGDIEKGAVYMIGMIGYELLTGETPFGEDTPQSAHQRVIEGETVDVDRVEDDIREVIEQMLTRDPGMRPGLEDILGIMDPL